MPQTHLSSGPQALHRGVYELALTAPDAPANPYTGAHLRVTFTRPDGRQSTVEGFYDGVAAPGGALYRARAYCDTPGTWRWQTESNLPALDAQSGTFEVIPSTLKGKLRVHPGDPYQFAYDDGDWFLHAGDTGYRYVTATEPEWQAYLDQAVQMGATKIRTWFCQGRSDVQVLFGETRDTLNLAYWQEIDRRLCWALERHPDVVFKLIPYGEDTAELRRYDAGDPDAARVAQYAQARFSALPNVYWCISNDREIVLDEAQPLEGRQVYARTIDRIGREMAAREPWGTLLTNHQCRWSGYGFVDAPWSDVITLEDMDQVDGAILSAYRAQSGAAGRPAPVVNDEDRYELYRPPARPRYFFRRLMWGSLLSGGHATYGGLYTYQPYEQDSLSGVRGYYDAVRENKLQGGADDFGHIHRFFRESGLTMVGLAPDDACVGDEPRRWKCAHDDKTYLVYLANPTGGAPETDAAAETTPVVTIRLPEGAYRARWYDPTRGEWHPAPAVAGGPQALAAPGLGDWLLVLERV